MDKVFIVSKEVFISEEDHYCDVVAVCSSEKVASDLVESANSSDCRFKTIYSYESFNVI